MKTRTLALRTVAVLVAVFVMMLAASTSTPTLTAQPPDDTCPVLVEEAIVTVGEACGGLARNTVCYGNVSVAATGADDSPLADFETTGDRVNVAEVRRLSTAGMDVEAGIWGVAMMSLQANIPDTLPGQNVIFVVYGDSALETETVEDFGAPMQAFTLSTGIGEPACAEAPNDGVLVQSPDGVTVNFLVNGIEVEIGSTALIDIRQDNKLWVSNLDGGVRVSSGGVTQTVEPGYKVLTLPGEAPHGYEPYTYSDVAPVPVSLLPEPITPPFTLSAREGAAEWVDSGIEVSTEYMFSITAYGEVNIFPECDPDEFSICDDMTFTPAGSHGLANRPQDSPPLPYGQAGALIARVGDEGEPFFVGVGGEDALFTADTDGTLQFRLNIVEDKVTDGNAEDNTGGFVIIVETTEEE